MSFSSKGHQNPTTARNLGDTVSKLVFVVNLTDLTCESEQTQGQQITDNFPQSKTTEVQMGGGGRRRELRKWLVRLCCKGKGTLEHWVLLLTYWLPSWTLTF